MSRVAPAVAHYNKYDQAGMLTRHQHSRLVAITSLSQKQPNLTPPRSFTKTRQPSYQPLTRPPVHHNRHYLATMSASVVPAVRANSASPTSSASRKAVKPSSNSMSASSSSSRSSSRSDPYHGHEETAVLCARFITSLFQCPNLPAPPYPNAPTPTLAHFVAYALHRTRLPSIVTFAALLLLQRLKARFPAARGSSGHRLFISAFMIASKVICDDTYSNQSWSIVGQKMFSLKEINQMEREMCGYLEWNLNAHGDEVVEFEAQVRAEHGQRKTVSAGSSPASDICPVVPNVVVAPYPTPDATPEATTSRPIRPVPSPYRSKPSSYQPRSAPPSPPASPFLAEHSPAPPFAVSNDSSLQSSPASDDCMTPSPVAVTGSGSGRLHIHKSYNGLDSRRGSDERHHVNDYAIHVGAGW